MGGRIEQHYIDELLARTDLVDIISPHVALKAAGRNLLGCCPFHDEKTPSFNVSPGKQFYHCFGCGASGNAITFLREHQHLSFHEALSELAQQAGMPPPEQPHEGVTSVARQTKGLGDFLMQVMRYYQEQLKKTPSAIAYLKERGISGETARDYAIGYAHDQWQGVMQQFPRDRVQLVESGMVVTTEKQRQYDRFRGRIMFPIRSHRGQVIGFGGRVLGDGQPKYMNSPETPLFHKGKSLYGLYEALQRRRQLNEILVVEGYMDVVLLAQHGIDEAVATLGTAPTTEHMQLLFRHCDNIVFCFDGDRAGNEAAWRALQHVLPLLKEKRQVRFLFLPEDEDPDSLVRAIGADAFRSKIAAAQPLSLFLFQRLQHALDLNTVEGRAAFVARIKPLLKPMVKNTYYAVLLEALSERMGIRVARLEALLRDSKRESPVQHAASEQALHLSAHTERALLLLVHFPGLAQEAVWKEVHWDENDSGALILRHAVEFWQKHHHSNISHLLAEWGNAAQSALLSQLAMQTPWVTQEQATRELVDLIRQLNEGSARDGLEKLLAKARSSTLSLQEKNQLKQLIAAKSMSGEG